MVIVTIEAKKRTANLVEKSGFSVGNLAKRIGTSYSTLWNFLHGDTRNFGKIQELADALGVTLYQLTTGNLDSAPTPAMIAADPASGKPQSIPHPQGYDKIPVHQVTNADGSITLTSEAAAHVSRLIGDGVTRVFGIKMTGDSMAPRYHWGEVVYCGTGLRPKPGDDCFVELEGHRGYLKTYVGEEAGQYVFRQYNPPAKWRIAPGEVRDLHAVVGRG